MQRRDRDLGISDEKQRACWMTIYLNKHSEIKLK